MGERRRAAAVLAMIGAVAVVVLGLPGGTSGAPPASAQLMTLPPTSTTAPASTTTEGPATTTTADATTTTRRATTTTRGRAVSTTRPATATTRLGAIVDPSTSTSFSFDAPGTSVRGFGPPELSERLVTTTTEAEVLALGGRSDSPRLSTGTLVALVVAGLLAVALVLTLITVRYVRMTRPGGV